jgi:effector-binding domain-containing protein
MVEVRIETLPEQPTAVVRERVAMSALPGFFGRAYSTVMRVLEHQGVRPTGMPFALYHGAPTDSVEVEAGFPLATPIRSDGAVEASILPACRAAQAEHVGPYDTLPTTYDAVRARIEQEGREPSDDMWEFYLSDPEREPDPQTWRTLVVWPMA